MAERRRSPLRERPRTWLDQVGSIADRGREIIGLGVAGRRPQSLEALCRRLVELRGEATALAVAVELVDRLEKMDDAGLAEFASLLASGFEPDPRAVERAIDGWQAAHDPIALQALEATAEAPRQELFRRLNMAPGGTGVLVRLRGVIGRELRSSKPPALAPVDQDLLHLLNSWFNRGFLQLREITWNTPAAVLERLIAHEAVHEIRGWGDLRGRLAEDRRCFAFFHPVLPDEPLVFVEVALTKGVAASIEPLIATDREIGDPGQADTAIFYSISNTQDGLRGISFGSFLIKQVMGELAAELPNLSTFATLSPVPGLARALGRRDDPDGFTLPRLRALFAEGRRRDGLVDPAPALATLVEPDADLTDAERERLRLLAVAYLTQMRRRHRAADGVAHFHLSNGARLERVHVGADRSAGGRVSCGVMVNYRYDPDQVEVNHERYVETGEVITSRSLGAAVRRARAAWNSVE
ncbi:MAG: malonyl-CoA decarboxylase [Candidatus Dormiibacterota bacterium]